MTNSSVEPFKFTVPFDEADGEGIVFFGNYFRLAHRALELYLPRIGIPWAEWFQSSEYGVPLRHAETEYLRPLRPGEEYDVGIRVAEIGTSSVRFHCEFRGPGGEVCARTKTSHVFVNRATVRKTDIPPSLRLRLESALR
ncbi:MAG: acyl-CoA thioesterase [Bdellovibrionales bacterium]